MRKPSVAIILLNFNNYPDTAECLNSLEKVQYEQLEIIVVDNASPDGSGEKIQKDFPDITYIQSGNNGGFSSGNNAGIQHALAKHFDYVMLLNNDTVVSPNFLESLVAAGEKFADVGIITGKGFYYSEPDKLHMCGGQLQKYKVTYKRFGADQLDADYESKEGHVNFASCYFMLVKSAVFREVGLLNDRYFGGTEETEFNYIVQKHGWKVYFCPQSKIWHKIGGSFRCGGYDATYLSLRNKMLFAKNNYTLLEKVFWYPLYLIYLSIVHVPKRFLINRSRGSKNSLFVLFYVALRAFGDGLIRSDVTLLDYQKYKTK